MVCPLRLSSVRLVTMKHGLDDPTVRARWRRPIGLTPAGSFALQLPIKPTNDEVQPLDAVFRLAGRGSGDVPHTL